MNGLVIRHDEGGVATLTLNRPDKLNALNLAIFEDLAEHVAAIATAIESVGVVVLRGAGRAFSAGFDLNDLPVDDRPVRPEMQSHVVRAIADLPQPVIVAVQGACFTGGLELALAGDLILASRSARFGDTHAKWGLTPLWGMSQRLPRRVGAAKAAEMSYTARTYTGEQAAAMGLANACFEDELFDAEVRSWADEIAANSWFSHRGTKRLSIETDGLPLAAGLSYEFYRSAGHAPDTKQRVARFTRCA